jgi:hypothetical protein
MSSFEQTVEQKLGEVQLLFAFGHDRYVAVGSYDILDLPVNAGKEAGGLG